MQNFFSQILNFVFKLVLAAFGLVFAACFLLAAIIMLLFGFAKWAVTGKKPAPFAAFTQFRQFSQGRSASFNPFSSRPDVKTAPQGDVVDVEVREVQASSAVKIDVVDAKSQS